MNMLDDTNFYQQQSQPQQYVPTGFQDRYYPNNAPPQAIAPAQPSAPPATHTPQIPHQQAVQQVPSPPPAPQPLQSHPTSINSLLSHDTPPPPSTQTATPRPQHHHHHTHHHHHHHHHPPSSTPLPRQTTTSPFFAANRLPPIPGARMNHIVDDRDRVKLEPRRDGYY
jgi:hypothetical protein